MQHSWICGCCGQRFDTLPLDYGFKAPMQWHDLPEGERAARAKLTDDVCTVDNRWRFVRGCVELPVKGLDDVFVWGVWASVSEESLKRILDLWAAPVPDGEPPRFGWLCNWIGGYPNPEDVKCHIHLQSGGLRPRIELEPSNYPLAVQQREGVTLDWVKERFALSHKG